MRCLARVPRPSAMTCLGKVPLLSACLDTLTQPSSCLETLARPSAMTCLSKVPRPRNGDSTYCMPGHSASAYYHDMPRPTSWQDLVPLSSAMPSKGASA